MIDFRYHLVSIIAVFLALAVGLLVGVTALSGPAESLLQHELNRVSKTNSSLVKDKQALINQLNADQAFAQAGAQRLLGDLLTDHKVTVVTAPGYDGTVSNGVIAALKQAGATVTGQVNLQPSFLDTSAHTEGSLTALAGNSGVALPTAASNPAVAGQQAAAAVIAAGILGKDGTASGASPAVLQPFAAKGYLNLSGLPAGASTLSPATMSVLVIPAAPTSAINMADQALVAVAQQLRAAGTAMVMTGGVRAIGPGSAISAAAGQVTTVDNADTEAGQIMVVWALVQDGNGQPVKSYGVDTGVAPSPAPTPSPSVSTSPSKTASTGGKKTGAKK